MTQPDTSTIDDTARATRSRVIFVGGVIPVLIAAVATVVMVTWLPELPDPIAIHWSGNGGPDGFGSAWMTILMPVVLTVLFCAFSIGTSLKLTPTGRIVSNQRFVLATGGWMAALLSVIALGTLHAQRGLADAAEAGDIGGTMLIGFGAAFVVAIAVWFLLPKHDSARLNELETPEPIAVAPGELVTWSRSTHIALPAVIVIFAALALALVTVVVTAIAAPRGFIIALVTLVVVTLLAGTTTVWRVTADRHGLTVRSVLGWPRIRIPLDDIADAAVTSVNPSAEFGGWGWRWAAGGRSGIIMRAGAAIEITKTSGKRFVVTVDDAETGASVLATLRGRHGPTIG